jgi:AraC-like DNA-binding protein
MKPVSQLTTHFAPKVGILSSGIGGDAPPVISALAMAGVSAFVREAFGDRVLRRVNQATMLDIELIEHLDCFIPQATATTFLDAVERGAGEPNLGLLFVPEVSISNLGLWGAYVLAADTLHAAIVRAASTLGHHCSGDRIDLSVVDGAARVRYVSAARGRPGYTHLAGGNAASLLSLVRSFVSPVWRPQMIELDIPRPRSPTPFEDAFSCPVAFDAAGVSIHFDAHLLDRPAVRAADMRLITLEDVARGRLAPANLDSFLDVIVAQIWAQVLAGATSIERAALSLDTSVRSLQRALNREGADFRTLTNTIRIQRARELLEGTRASITEISTALGYSAPAHFTRTFRKATGTAPQEFRRRVWSAGTAT